MARVPIQQTPEVGLEIGSAPQFTGGSIQPVQDTVTDDIQRFSKAQQNVANIAIKQQEEYNDAESKKLHNEYSNKINQIKNEYLTLESANAVGAIKTGNGDETETPYDQYIKQINIETENQASKASNGQSKYLFETMAGVTARSAQNSMTTHSIKEQRRLLDNETTASIDNFENLSVDNSDSWADPSGNFQKFYKSGLVEIIKKYELKGLETEGPTASNQFIKEINEYNDTVAKGVMDNLDNAKPPQKKQIDEFLKMIIPFTDPFTVSKLISIQEERHKNYTNKLITDAVLNNNSDQNNGDILNQANKLNTLASNNTIDNGIGGFVENGFNSNDEFLDFTGLDASEQTNAFEKLRNLSIFYDPEKSTRLIRQHQPTHLYAMQRLGVDKADSLYNKAKREYELPNFKSSLTGKALSEARKKFEKKFKTNPENEKIINAAILDKYNDLVKDAAEQKYSAFYGKTKTTFPNQPKRSDFPTGRYGGKAFSKAVKEFKNNPENEVKVNPGVATKDLETMTGTKTFTGRYGQIVYEKEKKEKSDIYINKIANDLEIIKNGINYDDETTVKTDFITGLTSLNSKKQQIKETITDKKDQQAAIKELEEKYNKIKNEKEANYNNVFNTAKEIAFAEPGGHKNLLSNGIDIETFTKEDQAILKDGPPQESNIETLAELDNNPIEVRDNLDKHSHKLSKSDFLGLKRYAAELRNDDKIIEASGDASMLKNVMYKNGYNWVYKKLEGNKAATFHGIKIEWIDRIDYVQKQTKEKLNRLEKEKILQNVLLDKINLNQIIGSKKDVFYSSVKEDQLDRVFVLVNGEKIFGNKIDKDVKAELQRQLYLLKTPLNEQNIAERWVQFGKPETLQKFEDIIKKLNRGTN
tara:strand:- start:2836 stop:5448 length:2613 start_codon:yes stop_codon:yes gene_type:complete